MAPSLWWAAPEQAERWFSEELLGPSRQWARRAERLSIIRTLGQCVLGLAVFGATAPWPNRDTPLIDLASTPQSWALMGVAVALVLWLPSVAVDVWATYRSELIPEVPPARLFIMGMFLTAAIVMGAGAGIGVVVAATYAVTPWWPVLIAGALGAITIGIGPVIARSALPSEPIAGELGAELDAIASQWDLVGVRWRQRADDAEAMNASAMAGSPPEIIIGPALLQADPQLRTFVVAHELAHLRRQHHRQSVTVSVIGASTELGAAWGAATMLAPRWAEWANSHLEAAGQDWPAVWLAPVALAAMALVAVPVGLIEAWIARHHERQADTDACRVGLMPSEEDLRDLLAQPGAVLDPRAPWRWFSHHPAPAERLALVRRRWDSAAL